MNRIRIGKIVNTFGLRGELKVKSYTDFPEERFQSGNIIQMEYNDQQLDMVVEKFREHKGVLLLQFKGFDSINDVEKYKGSDLYVEMDQLHDLDEGEYYFFELKGFEVVDESGSQIGEVKQVEEGTVSNYLRVVKSGGETCLIPFIDTFVIEVNKEEKRIVIKPIEGLL